MIRILRALLFFLFFLFQTAYASNGVTLTFPIIAKDPNNLRGYRAALWYQPEKFIWPHAQLFFDTSFGHWWVPENVPNRELYIMAIAPTLRYYFTRRSVSPFIDLSIGLSYLSNTRIETRNLGLHFAFQDQVGVGVTIGKEQRLSISASALHYSNGSMCHRNAGITIPLLINVGLRF